MAEQDQKDQPAPESKAPAKSGHRPSQIVRHTYLAGDGTEQTRYGLRVGKDQVVWLGPASDVAGLDDLEG